MASRAIANVVVACHNRCRGAVGAGLVGHLMDCRRRGQMRGRHPWCGTRCRLDLKLDPRRGVTVAFGGQAQAHQARGLGVHGAHSGHGE